MTFVCGHINCPNNGTAQIWPCPMCQPRIRTATIPHITIGPITAIWHGGNWQWFAGPGGDYGRFVLWVGPVYVAVR